jgi:hypothetical protein
MVSCHQLKRAAALAEEDLEATEYLSKILVLPRTANACRPRWNSGSSNQAMMFLHTSKTRDNEALTNHVK